MIYNLSFDLEVGQLRSDLQKFIILFAAVVAGTLEFGVGDNDSLAQEIDLLN